MELFLEQNQKLLIGWRMKIKNLYAMKFGKTDGKFIIKLKIVGKAVSVDPSVVVEV